MSNLQSRRLTRSGKKSDGSESRMQTERISQSDFFHQKIRDTDFLSCPF